ILLRAAVDAFDLSAACRLERQAPARRHGAATVEHAFGQPAALRPLLRELRQVTRLPVFETVAEGEQRIVTLVADVERRLVGSSGPAVAERPAEIVAGAS